MTTATLESPAIGEFESQNPHIGSKVIETLTGDFIPTRISFSWLGTRRAMTDSQCSTAASCFDADPAFVSGGKKIINTKSKEFKDLTKRKGEIREFWINNTIPYPERGIRLLRRENIDSFTGNMEIMRGLMKKAARGLNETYAELLEEAKVRLGDLFDPADYPSSLENEFSVEWDFPSVFPDDYLKIQNKNLWEKERQKVLGRFEEAASMAEEAFIAEFSNLVNHLIDRLSPDAEGNAKKFKDSTVNNLSEFFEKFKSLNVNDNAQLDDLIEKAQAMTNGVDASSLREDDVLRNKIHEQFSGLASQLDELIVARPKRRLIRDNNKEEG